MRSVNSMEASSWRIEVNSEFRQKIVRKMMEGLRKTLTSSKPEELLEVENMFLRCEEKIYAAATSRDDYLRRISGKLLGIETIARNIASKFQENSSPSGDKSQDTVMSQVRHFYGESSQSRGASSTFISNKEIQDQLLKQKFQQGKSQSSHSQSHIHHHQLYQKSLQRNELEPSDSPKPLQPLSVLTVQKHPQHSPLNQQLQQKANVTETQQSRLVSLSNTSGMQKNQGTSFSNLHQLSNLLQQKTQETLRPSEQATSDEHADHWREEIDQKRKYVQETYLPKLNPLREKLDALVNQHGTIIERANRDQVWRWKVMKHLLDRAFNLLSVPKSKIHPGYKEELDKCEKQLIDIWNKVSNSPTQPDTQSLKPQSQMPQPYLTNQVHDVKVRQSTDVGTLRDKEQPLERLVKLVERMSPNVLSTSVNDILSIFSVADRIAGSAPGQRSEGVLGAELVPTNQYRRSFTEPYRVFGTREIWSYERAMPSNFSRLTGMDPSGLESNASSPCKRPRIEANYSLLEEIGEINQRLVETVVGISNEDFYARVGREGTIVKCSFSAAGLCSNSDCSLASVLPIAPLLLLVPTSYPACSPILLEELPFQISGCEDLSTNARARLSVSLQALSQPMSLKQIARAWDACARAAVIELAQQKGGGTFSSKYGTWES